MREDPRLIERPLVAVTCQTCGGEVAARKSSWDQTVIKWSPDAVAGCIERRAAVAGDGANGHVFVGCAALKTSLQQAVIRGELVIHQSTD